MMGFSIARDAACHVVVLTKLPSARLFEQIISHNDSWNSSGVDV